MKRKNIGTIKGWNGKTILPRERKITDKSAKKSLRNNEF